MVELPVVAEEVVDAEAEVDLVVLLERVLEDEVVLVPHPLVGLEVRVDAEVEAVAGRPLVLPVKLFWIQP